MVHCIIRDNSITYEEVNDEDLLSGEILCDINHICNIDDAWRLAKSFSKQREGKS